MRSQKVPRASITKIQNRMWLINILNVCNSSFFCMYSWDCRANEKINVVNKKCVSRRSLTICIEHTNKRKLLRVHIFVLKLLIHNSIFFPSFLNNLTNTKEFLYNFDFYLNFFRCTSLRDSFIVTHLGMLKFYFWQIYFDPNDF